MPSETDTTQLELPEQLRAAVLQFGHDEYFILTADHERRIEMFEALGRMARDHEINILPIDPSGKKTLPEHKCLIRIKPPVHPEAYIDLIDQGILVGISRHWPE